MRSSKSFAEYEEGWKAFLTAIEKAWAKLELAAKSSTNSKCRAWLGGFAASRRTDPLLRYIKHARNVDHHTLAETVNFRPQQLAVKVPGGPGVVHIEKLEIGRGKIEYKGSHPLQVEYSPPQLALQPVKDRGDWYNPPTQHLGVALKSPDPISVAEHALKFYKDVVDEAASKFF